jgi:FkbM family methyltransferase
MPQLQRARYWLFNAITRVLFPVHRRVDTERLAGADHLVPATLLSAKSICWSAGVGEDTGFELALIRRFGCDIWALDPTPRAAQHAQRIAREEPSYHFMPVGLWHEDRLMRFYEASDPEDVSHSALNLQRTTRYFEARCRPLDVLMNAAGHDRIDLLKMDIEGAEYPVIGHLLHAGVLPKILLVEFHHREPGRLLGRLLPANLQADVSHALGWAKVMRVVSRLKKAGYQVVAVEGWHFSFVRSAPSI